MAGMGWTGAAAGRPGDGAPPASAGVAWGGGRTVESKTRDTALDPPGAAPRGPRLLWRGGQHLILLLAAAAADHFETLLQNIWKHELFHFR